MSGRSLPVLNFAPFRKYPTRLAEQEFEDEREVCGSCLSGACCASEDPIYLTSFDVFRLAAFFDLTPAEFLLTFTQERFDGEDSDAVRRPWLDDPECSKVTYLRRRGNTPKSPCVFLKYVHDADGTPRRVCSVHDARPLSCREFYFQHCKARPTGELAALIAEGYEKIRDGEITAEVVSARLARFGGHDFSTAPAHASMEYAFWCEMRRALDPERANVEGGRSYDARAYQDPIDEKLNRVLSAKYLRFEEKYGPRPNGEQLMPYTSGLGFVKSRERARVMKIVRTRPASGLYGPVEYPFHFGMRTMVTGVRHAAVFPVVPDAAAREYLDGVPPTALFPEHEEAEVRALTRRDVCAAALRGLNHLIRFSSYLAAMGHVFECRPPGAIELELLTSISSLDSRRDELTRLEPYVEPVRSYAAAAGIGLLEAWAASAVKPREVFEVYRRFSPLEAAVSALPRDLRRRYKAVAGALVKRLRESRLDDFVELRNPIAERLAAGRGLKARRDWALWEQSARDAECAAAARLAGVDVATYYRSAVGTLEAVPFDASYAAELCRVVVSLGCGLRRCGRVGDAAARLDSYGSRLLGWLDAQWGLEGLDDELLAGFASSVYVSGRGRSADRHLGRIVRRLLDGQLPDGSWGTNPPPAQRATLAQDEYLDLLHEPTWACLDGLRNVLREGPAAVAV
ncbi:MAG: YkgJ family cysteine cluster protein [Acidobacteria bacterium]|nr:YkgJ family cysteine cluster protein [Acidobacteriota bacterium]